MLPCVSAAVWELPVFSRWNNRSYQKFIFTFYLRVALIYRIGALLLFYLFWRTCPFCRLTKENKYHYNDKKVRGSMDSIMNAFMHMLNTQLILLVYLLIGVICVKKGFMDEYIRTKLIDFVLMITLPCMIFESFNQDLTSEVLHKTASSLIIAVGISLAALLLGKFIYLRYPRSKRVILQYATLVNNSGFMGLPLVESMYGADADFGSRCVIATTVMCLFTAPLLMLLA